MQLTDYMEQILALGLLAEKGWSAEQQIACLYSCSNAPEAHYYPLTIAKQNGGRRKLLVPVSYTHLSNAPQTGQGVGKPDAGVPGSVII